MFKLFWIKFAYVFDMEWLFWDSFRYGHSWVGNISVLCSVAQSKADKPLPL